MEEVIISLSGVIAQALMDEFDFTADMVNQIISRYMLKFECIVDGRVTVGDINEWCKDNGVKIG